MAHMTTLNKRIKIIRRAAYSVSLLLLIISSGSGHIRRFQANQEAKPVTRRLPAIDKVELMKLKLRGDLWDGEIESNKIVEGNKAQKIASLWRAQAYNQFSAACHNPAYAIKFYSKGKVIVYASLCWDCDNIDFITPDLKKWQSFYGKSRKGRELLKIFTTAFPQN
jgi:hypothetical protein